jgi:hypothetical protein
MTLRVNNVQVASTSIAGAAGVDIQSPVDFKVGGRYSLADWSTGTIDELQVWRGVMPPPIYSRHYNGGDGVSWADFKDGDEPNEYSTHFIGHRLDKSPSDMTLAWSSTNPATVESNANGTYGRLLEWPSGGSTAEKIFRLDHFAPLTSKQQIVCRFRAGTPESGWFRLLLHSSGSDSARDCWMMYFNASAWGFGKINGGTFTGGLGGEQSETFTSNVWYWAAFEAEPSGSDTVLRGKFWSGAVTDEPGSWELTHTVTGEQKTGRPGFGRFSTTGLVQCDTVFAGVGADAPRALSWPTGATGYRYRVQVDTDPAQIPGSATTYAERRLAILNPSIPDAMKTLGGSQSATRGEIRASTDEDGLLQIPIDVIRWDLNATPANSNCTILTKMDVHSDDVRSLYLWWGADDVRTVPWTLAENGMVNVHRSQVEEFLALDEDPADGMSNALVDRTANGRHGVTGGSMTSGDRVEVIDGIRGLDFDGSNDYLDTVVWSLPARDLTVSLLCTMRNMPKQVAVFGKHSSSDANQFLFFVSSDGEWHAFLDGTEGDSGVAAPTDAALHHIAHTITRISNTSSDLRTYVDGSGVTGSWNVGIDLPTTWTGKAWTNQDWDATATRTDFPDGVQAFRQVVNVAMTANEITLESNNLILNGSFWDTGTIFDYITNVSGAITQGGQTLSGDVDVRVTLSGSITQGGQTLAGTVTVSSVNTVSGAITQGGQTLTGALTLVLNPVAYVSGTTYVYSMVSGSLGVSTRVSGSVMINPV